MNYLTIKQTAARWGVSERTVNALCTAGRVAGARKFAGAWAIPDTAEKPIDPRRQKKLQTELEASIARFDGAAEAVPDILTQEKPLHLAMPLLNTPFPLGQARQPRLWRMRMPEASPWPSITISAASPRWRL